MHDDLRRRALESHKTTSNKAKSKNSSRASSAANSRHGSRVQSRDGSDDEYENNGNLSDETNHSINSIDALIESDEFNDQATDVLKEQLKEVIENILDRKGSNTKGREELLRKFVGILGAHYIADALYGRVGDLLGAFLKSIRRAGGADEGAEREIVLALRAVSLVAVTIEDEGLYEAVAKEVKRVVADEGTGSACKVAAVHCLAIVLSFGGAGEEEIAETLTVLQEIATSDGAYVAAEDDAEVVTAACQAYGFLATQVDDLEDESEDAVAAFLEQLDANSVDVQIAAGENIALLYEKSYTPLEEDETTSDLDDNHHHDPDAGGTSSDDDAHPAGDPSLVKQYNAYHNTNAVVDKVSALSSLSTKSLNKRDKRQLHQAFASILITIRNPKMGLQTNNASKMTVRIHRTGEMRIDRWWKLMRLSALRRLLGGGFVNHYFEGNKSVLECLPVILRETHDGDAGLRSPGKRPGGVSKASKGKWRDSRRFVSGEVMT